MELRSCVLSPTSLLRLATLLGLLATYLSTNRLAAAPPEWVWSTPQAATGAPVGRVYFRTTFEIPEIESATIEIACDNLYSLFVNNERVGAGLNWQELDVYEVAATFRAGKNCIAVITENQGGPAGLVARVRLKPKAGPVREIATGSSWKFATMETAGWREAAFDDSTWKSAFALGMLGQTAPWGELKRLDRGSTTPEFERKERPAGPFQLLDGDRVVFLGDTLVERASRDDSWETLLTARYPDRDIRFRNLGWSGDTVFGDARAGFGTVADGYRQLKAQVYETRPTVIFVCYGTASSFDGPAGLPAFQKGMNRLLDDLAVTKAELVLVSPLRQEFLPPPFPDPTAHNRDVAAYAAAIGDIARARRVPYVDLFSGVISLGPVTRAQALTDNGLHLNARGYLRMAAALESQLGWSAKTWKLSLNARGQVKASEGIASVEAEPGSELLTLRIRSHRLSAPGEAAASPSQLIVTGLAAGTWVLSAGGQELARAAAADWSQGMTLQRLPGEDQWEQLRRKITQKNQLYFHRWRPQNETYLFGFRKHEQGQNAKEIPLFDPLIEKLEGEIAVLRVPAEETFELRRQ